MRLLTIIFSLGYSAVSLGGDVSTPMDSVTFTGVLEKFYADLAQKNTAALTAMTLHYSTLKPENAMLYGEALVRSPDGPLAVAELPSLVSGAEIGVQFKEMTGINLVDSKVFIVRYPYSRVVKSAIEEKGVVPASKLYKFEDSFCDLWLYGSDGKWRVACNFKPFFRIDRQSLGLQLTEDKAYAIKRQKDLEDAQKRFEKMSLGPVPAVEH